MSRFSKKEIEERKEFIRMREFWLVYDDDDNNCDLLQAILDRYYNEYESTYTAEIIDHQNSSRLVVVCNVCNGAQLSSYDPFISHNNGKNHKKNLVERKVASENSATDRPILRFKSLEDIENPFEIETFEYDLFETTFDIIGYQFLYREMINNGEYITCQLCSSSTRNKGKYSMMKPSTALRHMKSDDHQDNYLKAKFDLKDSTLHDDRSRKAFIADVIKKEGKLMHRILTIDAKDMKEKAGTSKEGTDLESKSSAAGDEIKDPNNPETPEEFLEIIHGHLQHLLKIKKGDNIIEELKKDVDAMDLLISTTNVLSQKIYLFSENHNDEFKEQAKKLLVRCENLKLPDLKE